MKETYEESIGAFLYNEKIKKFLLLKRINNPFWEFPKGHIEENETHETAIKRELKEERGITELQILNKIGKISFSINKPNMTKKRIVYYYLVETDEENIILSPEHSEYIWLDYNEVLKHLKFKDIKNLFKKINLLI